MIEIPYEKINVGDALPSLTLAPVNRSTLALFAGASGDHNLVHIDTDFARKVGMPDVFAHGMLGMAWLSRLLIRWVPQSQLRHWQVRFVGIIHLGNEITCTGNVIEKYEELGEKMVMLDIAAVNQYGEIKISGQAAVGFSQK